MPTRYEQGRQAEYRARDRLLQDGFHTVLRMSGSHGPVDLIAVSPSYIKFIQVKSTIEPHPAYPQELAALKDWPVPEGAVKELWVWVIPERVWVMIPA